VLQGKEERENKKLLPWKEETTRRRKTILIDFAKTKLMRVLPTKEEKTVEK